MSIRYSWNKSGMVGGLSGEYVKAEDVHKQIQALTQERNEALARVEELERKYANCQDEFRTMEELSSRYIERNGRLYIKLAAYEAVVEAAKGFVNCDMHDGKTCGQAFDELELAVCKLAELQGEQDDE